MTQGRPETLLCKRLVNYFTALQFPGSLASMFLIITHTLSALSSTSSEDSENLRIDYLGHMVPELRKISMRLSVSVSTFSSLSSYAAALAAANSGRAWRHARGHCPPTVGIQSHENWSNSGTHSPKKEIHNVSESSEQVELSSELFTVDL